MNPMKLANMAVRALMKLVTNIIMVEPTNKVKALTKSDNEKFMDWAIKSTSLVTLDVYKNILEEDDSFFSKCFVLNTWQSY